MAFTFGLHGELKGMVDAVQEGEMAITFGLHGELKGMVDAVQVV
jgi:hypothetical protein